MKHNLYFSRLSLFALFLALLIISSGHVFAQEEDEDDDDEVSADSANSTHPSIRKFMYKFNDENGTPVEIMIGEPYERMMLKKNEMFLRSLEADSMYRNGLRMYFDAARPYFDMVRTEDDIDLMRLTDTTGYAKYKEIPDLERKSFELARAFHEAKKPAAKEIVEKELQNTLNKLFELREEKKEDEVKRIETDLQKTKAKMADRKLNKQTIVKRRMDQLLGKRDDLEW